MFRQLCPVVFHSNFGLRETKQAVFLLPTALFGEATRFALTNNSSRQQPMEINGAKIEPRSRPAIDRHVSD